MLAMIIPYLIIHYGNIFSIESDFNGASQISTLVWPLNIEDSLNKVDTIMVQKNYVTNQYEMSVGSIPGKYSKL